MVHKTVSSFHINSYANKSYLIDVDPPDSIDTSIPKFKILENTLIPASCKISQSIDMHFYSASYKDGIA